MEWNAIKGVLIIYGGRIIISLIVLILANFLINYLKKYFVRILKKAKVLPSLRTLIADIIQFVLWILTVSIILNIMGFKEISIALGGSIVIIGLGVAKSISNVVSDLIAGIFLILDEDFQVGYQVDTNRVQGIIAGIEIRKIKIKDADGKLHIIPNRNVDSSIIIVGKNSE